MEHFARMLATPTFSRLSTGQYPTELVSLEEVVGRVLNDLDLLVEETSAVVEVKPLPSLPGDASQLRQLFQDLLHNAFKFRRGSSQ